MMQHLDRIHRCFTTLLQVQLAFRACVQELPLPLCKLAGNQQGISERAGHTWHAILARTAPRSWALATEMLN